MSVRLWSLTLLCQWSQNLKQDINSIESVQRRFTKRLPGFGKCTYRKRLQLLNLPSLELRPLYFDLTWAYKIIFGYVDMCFDDFLELRSTKTTRGHPCKLFKRQCTSTVRSSFLLNRLLTFGIVYQATMLISLHSPHLSV